MAQRRDHFRIDDVLPLTATLVEGRDESHLKSYILYGNCPSPGPPPLDAGNEAIPPALWRLLVDIHARMELILERLNALDPWFRQARSVPVNISEGGIRFASGQPFRVGDVLEIRLLLDPSPGLAVVTHARVNRVETQEDAPPDLAHLIAAQFLRLEESVREAICRHVLRRQRECIRGQWDKTERERSA